jgi:hypothetical protein
MVAARAEFLFHRGAVGAGILQTAVLEHAGDDVAHAYSTKAGMSYIELRKDSSEDGHVLGERGLVLVAGDEARVVHGQKKRCPSVVGGLFIAVFVVVYSGAGCISSGSG